MPTPEILTALQATDDRLAELDGVLAGLTDADLHLAHRGGGWTAAQVVSHIDMSVLLWTAVIARATHDPDLAFVFREEIGHDVTGYPPPRIDVARRQLDSARRTLATCIPAIPAEVLGRTIEIPDLGTMTVEAWTPPIVGHAQGHVDQALDVLRDRGAIA